MIREKSSAHSAEPPGLTKQASSLRVKARDAMNERIALHSRLPQPRRETDERSLPPTRSKLARKAGAWRPDEDPSREAAPAGDALVDVDPSGNPVWVWNTFDDLDVNRHPMNFPDWTHSNDMLYSSDDHNLPLSIRHQNWVVKIEYLDGQGSGKVLWRLGEGYPGVQW
jgi:hypothetical protein